MTDSDYPSLTKRQAEVFHLHKKEINTKTGKNYTHKEIGKKLGIKWQTSRTLYYRACKSIKDMEITLKNVKD